MNMFTFMFLLIFVLTMNIGQRLGLDARWVSYGLLAFSASYIMVKGKVRQFCSTPLAMVALCFVATVVMRYYEGIMADSVLVLLNLLLPVLLLFVFQQMGTAQHKMTKVMLTVFVINSCMAIVEYVTKSYIVGWYEGAYAEGFVTVNTSAFRSVALWGGAIGEC